MAWNQRRERNTLELDSIFSRVGEDNYIEEIGDVEAFHHLIPNSYRPLPNASCLESEKNIYRIYQRLLAILIFIDL